MAYTTQGIRNVGLVGQAGAGKTLLLESLLLLAGAATRREPRLQHTLDTRLKALTGGEGAYAMELSHYDPVPSRKQEELMEAYRPHED